MTRPSPEEVEEALSLADSVVKTAEQIMYGGPVASILAAEVRGLQEEIAALKAENERLKALASGEMIRTDSPIFKTICEMREEIKARDEKIEILEAQISNEKGFHLMARENIVARDACIAAKDAALKGAIDCIEGEWGNDSCDAERAVLVANWTDYLPKQEKA